MSSGANVDLAYTNEFLERTHERFDRDELFGGRFEWVAGRAYREDVAILLFRDTRDGVVHGMRWNLAEFSPLFDPNSPADLAETVWVNEINDPSGPGEVRHVDWANGLIDDPESVRWLD